ncbi:SDR family oxidoreductase [Rhodococcus sp. BP-149]|jgi:NAD(P)-dependent dehydrogenase (short-subunit alcohol dehydrogenase family)|uniref:SDR family NAD(P)-dependent oxidoreductase n=1 Tax=unclassified Rhodococcus (in: high G+C Gram-positive bacteria) TaxID=192944 RepID=UPI000565ACB4|nr:MULTISPECIES: SDR family oxidoreductase [unclassified Rhodococcus (in: high G+C Gram-positive bacteria)]KQU30649.1 short-chain dehydrogenase [Rhodococcus sp. Leaf225]KQU44447.1 short-chain dehydrogenase [Rhodococcus sp. Leaf258]MBY6679996.1 SDR family oxidoreductase [Rhodococcus sp. BP-316]MBY6685898.1 SDR family oxidoreductase [Rhodococcus sp. BP-288]MBY6694554.1 SDR family oxidoreductase [Rhodococcus sp. BP-188]
MFDTLARPATVSRTAVVTGAASERGLGRATAALYAEQGWAVVVLDLDGEASAKVAADIANAYGVRAFGHEVDVADESSVERARAAVAAEVESGSLPTVGALANIAGITSPVPFLETTLDLWNKVMAVNATGTYLVTKAFLPAMIDAGWGRVVNMSSVSAQRGGGVFGKVPYSSAKAAVLGFTKALAREIGHTGVTVNAVTPGAADTAIRVGSTPEQEQAIADGIPVGRVATAREVAAIITFLSSEDASYLTGTTLDINGGSHMH